MRLLLIAAGLTLIACSTTGHPPVKTLRPTWEALLQTADTCSQKHDAACAELVGETPEASALFTPERVKKCQTGNEPSCCELASGIFQSGGAVATQNGGLAYLIDHCLGRSPGALFKFVTDDSVRRLASRQPLSPVKVTSESLRERAALFEHAEALRARSCLAADESANPDCSGPPLLVGMARTVVGAADRLEKTGAVCRSTFTCALDCMAGVGACDEKAVAPGGGGELAFAAGAGIVESLRLCVGGLDDWCAFGASMVDPLGADAIASYQRSCEQEGMGCDMLGELEPQVASVPQWLESACTSGRSGLACRSHAKAVHQPEPLSRELAIWQAKLTAHPDTIAGQRSLIEWASGVPAKERGSADTEAIYPALRALTAACDRRDEVAEPGMHDVEGPCGRELALLRDPASALAPFRERLMQDFPAWRLMLAPPEGLTH
jgi:hypothetical protein